VIFKAQTGLIVGYIICLFLWSIAMLEGWAERVYEQRKNKKFTWYWLRLFNIAETRENCIRFVKIISWIGMLLSIPWFILVFFLISQK
jgi:hypothetical protein